MLLMLSTLTAQGGAGAAVKYRAGGAAAADADALDRCIALVAKGDMTAFEELYELARTSVYSYSLSVLMNVHDAEDVLHDCFVNVYSSAGGYVSHGKPLAWILTIAKNLCYRRLRERKRSEELPDEARGVPDAEEGAAGNWQDAAGAAVTGLPTEDALLLREGLAGLSDDERKIVILHAVSGFKHREIAAFLELPLATVLSKYRRALTKLREFYLKSEM